jgi:hypothetical protein
MAIVFYIRGLFHVNNLTTHSGVDNKIYYDIFNKIYNYDILQYRREVNEIQRINLAQIGCRVIVNAHPYAPQPLAQRPSYVVIPSYVHDQLMSLAADDILIPLDDDDWISPAILDYPFDVDALNIWGAGYVMKKAPHYSPISICDPLSVDADLRDPENIKICRSLLSNCYGVPAKFIKSLITNTHIRERNYRLKEILQLHSLVRSTIRTHKIISKENIQPVHLAVYVRHLGNITSLKQWVTLGTDIDQIKALVTAQLGKHILNTVTDSSLWFSEYQNKLIDLNTYVTNNMRLS